MALLRIQDNEVVIDGHFSRICVLGGTGFVGRHVVHRFVRDGYPVRMLTRNRARHRDLLVMPTVELVECDIHDPRTLAEQFRGCDVVVNLVGILNETRGTGSFQRAHVDLPRKVIDACREAKVQRLLHMSALNADAARGRSAYLRTRGEGENIVHTAARDDFHVTCFRPSVIFGPEDTFFNRFATLLRLSPGIFPLACPNSRFAPVYVGDVAEAFRYSLAEPDTFGRRYDLCGPHVYTLKELVRYTARVAGLRRWVIGLGDTLSKLQAASLELVPGKPMSLDNYRSLQIDSVCQENHLPELGIAPTTVESVVPTYLTQRTVRDRYAEWRREAGRQREDLGPRS